MAKKKESVAQIRVTQIKSGIGCPADQKATIRALGLKRLHHSIVKDDSAVVRGMIFKVQHLVRVESVDA